MAFVSPPTYHNYAAESIQQQIMSSIAAAANVSTCWYSWTDTSTNTLGTNEAWVQWTGTGSESYIAGSNTSRFALSNQEKLRRKQLVSIEKQQKARVRAQELLFAHLDAAQRLEYTHRRRFYVTTASGRQYEVSCEARAENIYEVDRNLKRLKRFCIFQHGHLPLADNTLAQKLLLESDEKRFLEIANTRRLA